MAWDRLQRWFVQPWVRGREREYLGRLEEAVNGIIDEGNLLENRVDTAEEELEDYPPLVNRVPPQLEDRYWTTVTGAGTAPFFLTDRIGIHTLLDSELLDAIVDFIVHAAGVEVIRVSHVANNTVLDVQSPAGHSQVLISALSTATSGVAFADEVSSRGSIVYAHAANTMAFFTAGVQALTIDNLGNIELNLNELLLQNSKSIQWRDSGGTIRNTLFMNVADDVILQNLVGTGRMRFRTGGANDRAVILGTGEFGIGTLAPTNLLEVVEDSNLGDANDDVDVEIRSVNRAALLKLISNSANEATIAFGNELSSPGAITYENVLDELRFFCNQTLIMALHGVDNRVRFTDAIVLKNSKALALTDSGGTEQNTFFLNINDDILFQNRVVGGDIRFRTEANQERLRIEGGDGHVKMQGTSIAFGLNAGTTAQRDAVPNPVRGMLWHNTTTLAYDGYFSSSATAGSGLWVPLSTFPDVFFGSHIGPTVTPTAAAGVAVQVVGVLTSGGFDIFYTLGGAGTNEWTYTGPNMGSFTTIRYKGSVEKTNGGVDETFAFEVTVNGAPLGIGHPVATRQGSPVIFEAEALVSLNTNDVVSLQATNLASTDSITVQTLTAGAGG